MHILTRELHPEFLQVIGWCLSFVAHVPSLMPGINRTDLRNRSDRVNALGKLIARLPIEEYTLFRFLYAFAFSCLMSTADLVVRAALPVRFLPCFSPNPAPDGPLLLQIYV